MLQSISQLTELSVEDNGKDRYVPHSLKVNTRLRSLDVAMCEDLQDWLPSLEASVRCSDVRHF